MKTETELRELKEQVLDDYEHVLNGSNATIHENAPRALLQLEAKTKLETLCWALDENVPREELEVYHD